MAEETDEAGRCLVVRNDHHRPRTVTTAAGSVEVTAPQVDAATGDRMRFSSNILPPWCRKSPEVGEELLALRLALLDGRIDAATSRAVVEYVPPVPLVSSGSEAAAHGEAGVGAPDEKARHLINKITRTHNDLVQ